MSYIYIRLSLLQNESQTLIHYRYVQGTHATIRLNLVLMETLSSLCVQRVIWLYRVYTSTVLLIRINVVRCHVIFIVVCPLRGIVTAVAYVIVIFKLSLYSSNHLRFEPSPLFFYLPTYDVPLSRFLYFSL